MYDHNPFPGMNPWMEWHWESVHNTYIQYCRKQVAEQLPEGLYCDVEENVYVVETDSHIRRVRPDLAVFGIDRDSDISTTDAVETGGAATGVATPVLLDLAEEPVVETHVVIRSANGDQPLITAIEVISPTNKLNKGNRGQYKRKRRGYVSAGANVVEIDLLREGRSIIELPIRVLPASLLAPYQTSVRRAPNPAVLDPKLEYYPLRLRVRLPRIRIPLRLSDQDIVLDLQQPIDHAYEDGRYGIRLNYEQPPRPPLNPDDAAWARQLIAEAANTK